MVAGIVIVITVVGAVGVITGIGMGGGSIGGTARATANTDPRSGPAVDGVRPMLRRAENAKENVDRNRIRKAA